MDRPVQTSVLVPCEAVLGKWGQGCCGQSYWSVGAPWEGFRGKDFSPGLVEWGGWGREEVTLRAEEAWVGRGTSASSPPLRVPPRTGPDLCLTSPLTSGLPLPQVLPDDVSPLLPQIPTFFSPPCHLHSRKKPSLSPPASLLSTSSICWGNWAI